MDENINKHFKIECEKCGSTDVDVFPSGFGGEITIACCNCDNEVEV